MNGAITRTFARGTANRWAMYAHAASMYWVQSWSVSRSPSQTAIVAWGSIAFCCSGGVVYRRSTETGAAVSAASASPFFARPRKNMSPFAAVAVFSSAAKSTADGMSW
jgi:hypothetical protein